MLQQVESKSERAKKGLLFHVRPIEVLALTLEVLFQVRDHLIIDQAVVLWV